ncbi:MAG: DUF2179 domain-containing protein [Bacteroidota bacterium]
MTINEDIYNWVVFPLLIFLARMCDVSLGTLRGVLASKGFKKIVPFIGFVEVLIWLIAISQIMKNLNNVMCYVGWAGGYAMGSYLGLTIEEKLAFGTQVIRIVTNQACDELVEALKKANYGFTMFDGQGSRGPVKMILTIVKRKEVKNVIILLNIYNPNSFYSVEDIKEAQLIPSSYERNSKVKYMDMIFPLRKGK